MEDWKVEGVRLRNTTPATSADGALARASRRIATAGFRKPTISLARPAGVGRQTGALQLFPFRTIQGVSRFTRRFLDERLIPHEFALFPLDASRSGMVAFALHLAGELVAADAFFGTSIIFGIWVGVHGITFPDTHERQTRCHPPGSLANAQTSHSSIWTSARA